MTRRRCLNTLLTGLGVSAHPATVAAAPKDVMETAANVIQKQVDAKLLEAAVLHVQQGGEVFQRSFGGAANTEAIFLLASITKTMTAAGVMVLTDRGEVKLSDPVVKFIPEFSEGARKEITIRQLLTHTSGLPDQLPENDALRARHAPLEDFVRAVVRTPLLFQPGSRYHYQSMGILLAAEIVQRVAQIPLASFLEKNVFTPLSMHRTAFGLGRFKLEEVVLNQTEHAAPESGAGAASAKDWDWNSAYWRNLGAPWGGGHGTAGDVAAFLRSFMHPQGRALREATARMMIEDQTGSLKAGRGIGFDLRHETFGKSCSAKAFGHSGSTGNLAWADPEKDLSCVILTSLPGRVSSPLILHPVSDLVSAGA
ncbi:MAG TPA: serine hydrolase domain-containing protein [Prosthecobacter sp.]|nr:serine hydrolase domain-containing protein [Prosthecobacter sp.]